MQFNQKWKVFCSLLGINTVIVILILVYLFAPKGLSEIKDTLAFDSVMKFTLYIGISDKDSYEQLVSICMAREIVNEICSRHVSGWTVVEGKGGWINEKNILTQESTLVYSFINTDESAIISIMQEVLVSLNQSSILIERSNIDSQFFYGN